MSRMLYDKWTIHTALGVDQVAQKINSLFHRTVTPETFRGKRGLVRITEFSYHGHVEGDSFLLKVTPPGGSGSGQRLFVARGTLKAGPSGTDIEIEIPAAVGLWVVMSLWFAVSAFAGAWNIYLSIAERTFRFEMLLALVLVIVGLAAMRIFHWTLGRKVREFKSQIIELVSGERR